jgi:leader peptidase (prepilin peptidase) / N-methyltransferase
MLPGPLIAGAVFLFGLLIGSFLNVCIVRIPAGKSIVLPASSCPKCGAPIKPYDNIPVISYLLLGGKCRGCRTKISPMYPLVELLNGALYLVCYLAFGMTIETIKWSIFSSLLLILVFTDLRERILPDVINYTGFAIALVMSLFLSPSDGSALWIANHYFAFAPPMPVISLADAIFGAAFGSGILWIISEGYFRLRKREGMGLGDVKMMLMAGAFLGLKRTVLTILLGSILGSIIGVAFIAIRRKGTDYELPFGTFLGAGALIVVFYGTPFVNWYMSLLRVH